MPSFWENLRFAGDRDFDDLHGYQGLDMVAYVSHPPPSEGTSWPAVVVVQEAFGVNEHIQKVCDRFAAMAMSPSPRRCSTGSIPTPSWATPRRI